MTERTKSDEVCPLEQLRSDKHLKEASETVIKSPRETVKNRHYLFMQ